MRPVRSREGSKTETDAGSAGVRTRPGVLHHRGSLANSGPGPAAPASAPQPGFQDVGNAGQCLWDGNCAVFGIAEADLDKVKQSLPEAPFMILRR